MSLPPSKSPRSGKPVRKVDDPTAILKKLLWLYFFLLVFEGALRKWVVPSLSAPLLLARDPVVLLIYFLAQKHRLFPESSFLSALSVLAFLSTLLSLIQGMFLDIPPKVLLYGLRTNYLHVPLIFIMPRIFKERDLRLLTKWILWISLPMALLMAYQFRSAQDAWINRAVGLGSGQQLISALGKIRPPGTFSFINGAVSFFSLALACLGFALSTGKKGFGIWMSVGASVAISIALVVSGSRSMILSAGLVGVGWGLGLVLSRQIAGGFSRIALLAVGAALVVMQFGEVELFQEGTSVLTARFESASGTEHATGGMSGRFLETLTTPLFTLGTVPMIGYGLGVGTNVGAMLIQGQLGFMLAESEWGRLVLEMGPVLGLGFILLRVSLTFWLGKRSFMAATKGNIFPLLLWSACATGVFSGQFAQPTSLGFIVFVAGLCLAAIESTPDVPADKAGPRPRFSPRDRAKPWTPAT